MQTHRIKGNKIVRNVLEGQRIKCGAMHRVYTSTRNISTEYEYALHT